MKLPVLIISILAVAALVAGCQREHLVQPGTGPTAQAAPPLANEDISAIYAARHVSPIAPATESDIRESRAHPLPLRKSVDVATAVVLMPRLPFPDAAAVVLRRPSLWPASVIMLQEDSLSVGAFESALFALSNEVTRERRSRSALDHASVADSRPGTPDGKQQGRAQHGPMDSRHVETGSETHRRRRRRVSGGSASHRSVHRRQTGQPIARARRFPTEPPDDSRCDLLSLTRVRLADGRCDEPRRSPMKGPRGECGAAYVFGRSVAWMPCGT